MRVHGAIVAGHSVEIQHMRVPRLPWGLGRVRVRPVPLRSFPIPSESPSLCAGRAGRDLSEDRVSSRRDDCPPVRKRRGT